VEIASCENTVKGKLTYVRPDMFDFRKAISELGFYPVSAVQADDHYYGRESNLASTGSTFGGQPNRCKVANCCFGSSFRDEN